MNCKRLLAPLVFSLVTLVAISAQDQPNKSPIDWQDGPGTSQLGSIAEVEVPESLLYAGKKGAITFLKVTQNFPSGQELGVVYFEDENEEKASWFVIFSFDPTGYVKDDEKDDLKADELLETITRGTEQSNKTRRKKGWPTMKILGWHTPPEYDLNTNNLVWAVKATSEGEEVINYNTRLLGRKGIMEVGLVIDPKGLDDALPKFVELLKGFSFKKGERYLDYKSGDKIAQYGLTALIAGGAGAVALKTGLFARFWKLIVVVIIAIGAFFKRIFNWMFNREGDAPSGQRGRTRRVRRIHNEDQDQSPPTD